jgi:hypothetical protein
VLFLKITRTPLHLKTTEELAIIFLGAGASKTFGVPTMPEMAKEFSQRLVYQKNDLFNLIVNKLKNYRDFDIEALITVLERIVNVDRFIKELNNPSLHYFLDNLAYSWQNTVKYIRSQADPKKKEAANLLRNLKEFIRDVCAQEIEEEKFSIFDLFLGAILDKEGIDFKVTLKKTGPKAVPYEIFTTNYDMIVESYCRSHDLLYENGEMGDRGVDISSRNMKLYGGARECFKIFKLHGSINWGEVKKGKIIARDVPVKPDERTIYGERFTKELVIYPAREFYTFREPFYDMFNHMKDALVRSYSCYIVGYSFRDPDITGIFFDAVEKNDKLTLYFIDPNVDEVVNERLSRIENRIVKIDEEFGYEAIERLKKETTTG